MENIHDMKKSDIILEIQKLGGDVNPNVTKDVLIAQYLGLIQSQTNSANNTDSLIPNPTLKALENPKTDMEKLMEMMTSVVKKVDTIDKEVQRIKDGGVNEYKAGAKPEDVAAAESLNAKLDTRIANIIENTLGVDFSADMTTFPDKPGFLLNINVPRRLSPIPMSYRPVKDLETGEYKKDLKSGRVEEEEYWPGDRRSVAIGSSDSFDVVQTYCNRVRAFILATYQKTNRPQPEFRTR